MRYNYDDIYKRLLKGNGLHCPVCGKPMSMRQKAHILGQGKASRKMWGDAIIDHKLNSFDVCSLDCNNSIQLNPGSRPEECRKHAAFIVEQISKENSGDKD